MNKKKKWCLIFVTVLFFIFASISYACYIKNQWDTGNGIAGTCSNNGGAIGCSVTDDGRLWQCDGPAKKSVELSKEEAVKKACGCD